MKKISKELFSKLILEGNKIGFARGCIKDNTSIIYDLYIVDYKDTTYTIAEADTDVCNLKDESCKYIFVEDKDDFKTLDEFDKLNECLTEGVDTLKGVLEILKGIDESKGDG